MFTNETAKKFSGNLSLYAFHARYRQRIFLQRNIDRALQYNEEQHRRRGEAALSAAAAQQLRRDLPGSPHPNYRDDPDPAPTRSRARINDIANRLKTEVAITGNNMPILKVDLSALRAVPRSRRNSSVMSDIAAGEGSVRGSISTKRRPKTIRCRCIVTIFGRAMGTDMRSRIKGSDRNQVYRDSELCTITMDPDDPSSATIELDDPFYIKASKLFVLTYRGPIKCFSLADSYYFQISLAAVDPDQIWPPPLLEDMDSFFCAASAEDPHSIQLIATFPNLPQVPKRGEFLRVAITAGTRRCDNLQRTYEVQVDCGWSNPFSLQTSSPEEQVPQINRLPTPNSEKGVTPSIGVPVNYHFRRNTADAPLETASGVNGAGSNYGKFTVKGYVCPLCDRKEFQDCNRLHFHLVTCHDLFEFQVKQKKSPRGNDAYADIWMDLSKKYSGVVSEKTKDPRAFFWIRPKEPFVLKQILDGNWRWLNEKNLPPLPQQLQLLQRDRGSLAGEKRFNVDDVVELQARKRRKYVIPRPLHKLKGPVFIRGKSKRFCYEGEEMSESDEEADEDWLKMKHEETIDDFEDVGVNEQTFMKMFDRHLFKERPIAYVHLPETLVRFARSHREWLRSTNQTVEFFKHLLNLIQYGMIDAEILQHCMQIVKGDQWNCTETAKVGLGMAGPLPLDELEDGEVRDAMDVDVTMEDVAPEPPVDISYMPSQSSGCPCDRPFKRAEVIYCEGQKCGHRWFHISCVALTSRVPFWKCKICSS